MKNTKTDKQMHEKVFTLMTMAKPSAEAIWNATPMEIEQILNAGMLRSETKRIQFYAPSFTFYKTPSFCSSSKDFPTISVTGSGCALNCKHCGGKVLETMHSASTPEKLLDLCTNFKQAGAKGVLVSGGCLPDGSVPLENFMFALSEIKRTLGLTIFVHTGIVDEKIAGQLKTAGVDAALIDIIGSDETIKEIYNLKVTAKNYEYSLRALHGAEIAFVPHVIVGLHRGELKGEFAALNMIKQYKPSAIVVISFMPLKGTFMAKTKPPTPLDIARTTAAARAIFPTTPLVLGCMRPKGKHRTDTDILALKAGVDGIAFPSENAIQYAKAEGFEVGFSEFCCAQIYKDLSCK